MADEEENLVNAVPPPPAANKDVNSQEWRTWFFQLRESLVAPVIFQGNTGGGSGGGTTEDPQALTDKNYSITGSQSIPADAHVVCVDSSSGVVSLELPASPESRYIHIKKISNDLNDIVITSPLGDIDGSSELRIKFYKSNAMLLKTESTWKVL